MSTDLFFSEMATRPKHSLPSHLLTAFTLCWQRVDEFMILDEVWQFWNNFPSSKVELLYYVI